jgi:cytochrome c6
MKANWLILGLFAWAISSCGNETNEAPSAPPISPAESGALYVKKCSLCHGADGKLGASGAPDLALSRMDYSQRERIIRYGKGLMPPQKSALNDSEIAGIARYLDTFASVQ